LVFLGVGWGFFFFFVSHFPPPPPRTFFYFCSFFFYEEEMMSSFFPPPYDGLFPLTPFAQAPKRSLLPVGHHFFPSTIPVREAEVMRHYPSAARCIFPSTDFWRSITQGRFSLCLRPSPSSPFLNSCQRLTLPRLSTENGSPFPFTYMLFPPRCFCFFSSFEMRTLFFLVFRFSGFQGSDPSVQFKVFFLP